MYVRVYRIYQLVVSHFSAEDLETLLVSFIVEVARIDEDVKGSHERSYHGQDLIKYVALNRQCEHARKHEAVHILCDLKVHLHVWQTVQHYLFFDYRFDVLCQHNFDFFIGIPGVRVPEGLYLLVYAFCVDVQDTCW